MGKPISKVLLIAPPSMTNNERSDTSPATSLGIGYIAAVLEKAGYEVKILDAFVEGWEQEVRVSPEKLLVGMPFEDIKEFIAAEKPDVVGISSMFTIQQNNAHQVARVTKEVDPNIKVIVGGAHPTSAIEMVLSDPNVDVVVLGEGDNSIVPLLEALERDTPLTTLDGVAYRGSDGRLVIQPKTKITMDLDEIPYPARHLMPMDKYFAANAKHGGAPKGHRASSFITSRGCQYRCNFCTAYKVFTRIPRMRSIENVVGEVQELVTKYGVDEIFFEDDQFIAKTRHTGALLDALAEFKIMFDTPNGTSPWLLDENMISKMANAGWHTLWLAIESGNQDILKNVINKPVKLDEVPEVTRLARKYGLDVMAFIVVGNITRGRVETLDEVRDSFRFVRKIRVRPQVSYLTGYPGSEVLEIAEENNWLIPGFDWNNHSSERQQIQTPLWSPEEIRHVVEDERLKTMAWYWLTNPGHLRHAAWQYMAPKDPKKMLTGIKKFVKLLKDLVDVGLSSLGLRIFRNRKVGGNWGLDNDQLVKHNMDMVKVDVSLLGGSNGEQGSANAVVQIGHQPINRQLIKNNASSAKASKDQTDRIPLSVLR